MTRFTDLFVKRPVLATVVSLLIFAFGMRAIFNLTLRQFPKTEKTVITVTTAYPGASAKLIQGFITTPIQQSIASAEGIDYITAESTQGVSKITADIRLNFDPNVAFTDIMSKTAEVRSQLPRESEDPVITKSVGDDISLMYLGFNSDKMSRGQITDYLSRVVQPKLETVAGVSKANILGANTFAMRIWLNPQRMAALNVTMEEVRNALMKNNFQSGAGSTKGGYIQIDIDAATDVTDVKAFKELVLKTDGNSIIRMKDVAKIELGAESYDSSVIFNGKQAVFMSIDATPTANPLDVINKVRKVLPDIKRDFPPSMTGKIVYDGTKFIRSSIREVMQTILEATIIVVLVIYLFLGSLRTVVIPIVTIPLSLIGVCSFMLMLGYSLNLLTLLAMVLAIGLVVDDAIVVVENIHRHIEEGLSPFKAAIQGAREIAWPVIAMTVTLAAVYAPIGFMGGLTGSLFKEFAFTLASAVIISGIIALTLSPMMCSKILISGGKLNKFEHALDQAFEKLRSFYQRRLDHVLDYRPVTLLFAAVVLMSCFFMYSWTAKELAPEEDKSILFVSSTAPHYANIDYTTTFTKEFDPIYNTFKEKQDYFLLNGMGAVNNVISGMILKPWDERKKTQKELQPVLQEKLSTIAGLKTAVFPLPSLPGTRGLPVQFVITGITGFPLIQKVSEELKLRALKSGKFIFVDSNLRFDKPELDISINRNKAALLGLNMQDIGLTLASAMGGNYINRFDMEGRSYEVIPKLMRNYRLNPKQIGKLYVQAQDGTMVPLSTVIDIKQTAEPNKLQQFQQLNSATVMGVLRPGVTLGDGLDFLKAEALKILPKGMSFDYAGESRQFTQEGSALVYTFFFALLVIFLVLSAQFESFRDPLIILISVPMSICGALIPLFLGLSTINIYTQVGLITLIGLITKHGILMVEFANNLQEEGLSKREAIEKAASIRLRAILMTTGATMMGVFPLVIASGAGAASRFSIGLVVMTGMGIGTLFTLFVVPTMYLLLAKDHSLVSSSEDASSAAR